MSTIDIIQNVPTELFGADGNTAPTKLLVRDDTVSVLPSDYRSRLGDRLYDYAKTNGSITLAEMDAGTFDPEFTSAEDWLEAQGYGGSRPTLLLYRKMQLDALGLQSLKLTAAQFWMDNLLAAVSLNPDEQRSDWQPAPYPFAEVTAECQQLLTPPTEPPAAA
jgi:hypothetical protein